MGSDRKNNANRERIAEILARKPRQVFSTILVLGSPKRRCSNHMIFFLLLLSCHADPPSYKHTVQLSADYKLSWTIANGTFFARADVNTVGWVGFGLSPVDELGYYGMPYADIWVGIFDPATNQYTVRDYYRDSALPGEPTLDTDLGGTNDIITYSGGQAGTSFISWSRKLVTNDTKWDAPVPTGDVNIIYAWGAANDFAWHGLLNTGTATVNFLQ